MGLRDRAHPSTVDDEFFRQLAGEAPLDTPPAALADVEPGREAPSRGPIDPHALHPIDTGPPPRPRRRARQTAQEAAHRQRDRPGDRARRTRLTAATGLVVVVVAVALVVLGADEPDRSQATSTQGRGAPNGNSASEEARLGAWWSQDGNTEARERWRHDGQATIQGRLTSDAGGPIANAAVTVLAADATRPQEGNRTVGEVRTDDGGRFEAAIALDEGAARKRLTFSYLAYANDTVPAAEQQATVAVYAPISLDSDQRDVTRGDAVALDGRSAPSAQVALLASSPDSGRWRELADVQADREGRWRATVRAPRDASPGRWRFLARVAPSRDDGFLGADSEPLAIEVR